MKKIDLILKVTDACNLRCKYCYNSEKKYVNNIMSLDRFAKLLELLHADYSVVHVIWHGGEPLTAGLDFYRQALDEERKINIKYGTVVENSIQTNGTMINAAWAEFFKKNNFHVGISFDGVANDKYRGGTDKTLAAMKLLQKHGVKFSCLAVVADNDYDLRANYKFFADMGVSFDFNQMFCEGGAKDMPSLDIKGYTDKLVTLFDEWLYDVKGVPIRKFVSFASLALGGRFRICSCCSCHTKYLSMSPDGTLYNCGRDAMTAFPFGNIDDVESVKQLFASEGARRLITLSVARRNKCKESCDLFPLCAGGCADIAASEGGIDNQPSNYCYYFRTLYTHVKSAMDNIVANKVPLSKLNPGMKRVFASTMVRDGGSTDNDLAESYDK